MFSFEIKKWYANHMPLKIFFLHTLYLHLRICVNILIVYKPAQVFL